VILNGARQNMARIFTLTIKINKYENRTWYPERTARPHLNVPVHPIEHQSRPDVRLHHNANEYHIHMLYDD